MSPIIPVFSMISYSTSHLRDTFTMDPSEQDLQREAQIPTRPPLEPIQNEAVPQSGGTANTKFQHQPPRRPAKLVDVGNLCSLE